MGIHFTRLTKDQKSTNQNNGVRFDATTERGKDTYYGYIVDVGFKTGGSRVGGPKLCV